MVKMKEIAILGRPIQLQERSKAQMKGVTIGEMLSYKFYDGEFHGMPLLFAEPKDKVATPRSLSITANKPYFVIPASNRIFVANLSCL